MGRSTVPGGSVADRGAGLSTVAEESAGTHGPAREENRWPSPDEQ
jgi:hypothetical protein